MRELRSDMKCWFRDIVLGKGVNRVIGTWSLVIGRWYLAFEQEPMTNDRLLAFQFEISKMTFPASPDLITRIASACSSSGNRCVITGRGSNCPDLRNCVIWIQVSYIRRPTTP